MGFAFISGYLRIFKENSMNIGNLLLKYRTGWSMAIETDTMNYRDASQYFSTK
jgi:hypothetical protein